MAIEVVFSGIGLEDLQTQIKAFMPDLGKGITPKSPAETLSGLSFTEMMVLVSARADKDGYDIEVTKRDLDKVSTQKKEDARAKLRDELIASLAKGVGSAPTDEPPAPEEDDVMALPKKRGPGRPPKVTAPLDDLMADVKEEAKEYSPKAIAELNAKASPQAKANGAVKTPKGDENLKAECIAKLQDIFAGGNKLLVKKLLGQFGNGATTFSSIPAEEFGAIAEALWKETL